MKTQKLISLLLALGLILSLVGCGSTSQPAATEAPKATEAPAPAATEVPAATEAPDEYGEVVIQNGDRTVTFTEMPTGVLCLNLYSAENMVMLGLGDYVLGKNIHTNPAEVPLEELSAAFEKIPEIEATNENAVASGCDLMIGQISSFKDTTWGSIDQLEGEGINCLTITGTIVPDETVEDIYTDIRNLGKIFKVEDRAEALIQQMKDEIAETNAVVADVKEEEKPRVFVFDMYKEDQIYTTSSGLESNLIELAGGINTTRGMADSRWFMASVESLVAANPDIIIINDYGKQTVDEKIAYIKNNEACSDIPAVVNDNFLIIPLVAVMQDIRASRACRTMAEYFYPDRFSADGAHYPVTINTFNYAKEPIEVTFDKRPERVICTNQTQTEMLLYLGLDDVIVGTAYLDGAIRSDLQPQYDALVAAGKELTVKGYPSKEVVLSLEPDFIFGWRSAFRDEDLGDVSEWNDLGVATMILRCSNNTVDERNLDAVLADFADIGAIFDIEDVTDAYIAEANAMRDEIAANVAKLDKPLTAIIVEPYDGTFYCWGSNTLTGNLVVSAGAEYALPDGGDLSVEDIVVLNPDVIIVDYMEEEGKTTAECEAAAIAAITDQAALAEVPAVANGKVMAVNLTDVYGGGIRMVPSVQAMYDFMYGD